MAANPFPTEPVIRETTPAAPPVKPSSERGGVVGAASEKVEQQAQGGLQIEALEFRKLSSQPEKLQHKCISLIWSQAIGLWCPFWLAVAPRVVGQGKEAFPAAASWNPFAGVARDPTWGPFCVWCVCSGTRTQPLACTTLSAYKLRVQEYTGDRGVSTLGVCDAFNVPTVWPSRLLTPITKPSANSSGPWTAPCRGSVTFCHNTADPKWCTIAHPPQQRFVISLGTSHRLTLLDGPKL